MQITCGHCGTLVDAAVRSASNAVTFLLCPVCEDGSVKTRSGAIWPPAPAGRSVPNLPKDIEIAWREARSSHAVAAYTAAEMMCRKILMHLAVDVAGSDPGRQFVSYIDDLEAAGYITTGLKPVVDKLRQRGNFANHELPASSEADSLVTIQITEYLLRGIYELSSLATP